MLRRLLPSADTCIAKFTIFLYYVAFVFGYAPGRLETVHAPTRQRTIRLRPLNKTMRRYTTLTAISAALLLSYRFWKQFFDSGLRNLKTVTSFTLVEYCIVAVSCCFILSAIYVYNSRHKAFYRLCKDLWQLQQQCRRLSMQHLDGKAPFFRGAHALLLFTFVLLLVTHYANFVLYQLVYRMFVAAFTVEVLSIRDALSSLLALSFVAYTQALMYLHLTAYVLALLYLDAVLLLLRRLLDSRLPTPMPPPCANCRLNCLLIAVRRHLWSTHRIQQGLNALCSAGIFWIYANWFLWSIMYILFTYFYLVYGDICSNVVIILCEIFMLNLVAARTTRRFREACNALDRQSRRRKRHINLHDHRLQIVANDFHFGCYRLFRFDCGLTLTFYNTLMLYVTTWLQMAMAFDMINTSQIRMKKRLSENT